MWLPRCAAHLVDLLGAFFVPRASNPHTIASHQKSSDWIHQRTGLRLEPMTAGRFALSVCVCVCVA